MSSKQKQVESSSSKRSSWRSSLLTFLIAIAITAIGFFYGATITDWVKGFAYTPSEQVAATNNRIGFTPRGQQIFYATFPSVEDKTQFNASCSSGERTVAILGCYVGDRIYIYNIQNAELDGTLEVTAAHEMLHAAYQRLNYFERQQVDAMIKSEYETIKDVPEISQIMQYYTAAEPGAELDELHSIIGTTIKDLPAPLEVYYGRYFSNRSAIVTLNEKYNAVFSSLTAQADELQKKVDTDGKQLQRDMATYQIDLNQLNLDIQSFNSRANSGGFTTQSEFTTARTALEARVATLNDRRSGLNARADAYNNDIAKLNALAVHVNKLNESINGVEAPSGV